MDAGDFGLAVRDGTGRPPAVLSETRQPFFVYVGGKENRARFVVAGRSVTALPGFGVEAGNVGQLRQDAKPAEITSTDWCPRQLLNSPPANCRSPNTGQNLYLPGGNSIAIIPYLWSFRKSRQKLAAHWWGARAGAGDTIGGFINARLRTQ